MSFPLKLFFRTLIFGWWMMMWSAFMMIHNDYVLDLGDPEWILKILKKKINFFFNFFEFFFLIFFFKSFFFNFFLIFFFFIFFFNFFYLLFFLLFFLNTEHIVHTKIKAKFLSWNFVFCVWGSQSHLVRIPVCTVQASIKGIGHAQIFGKSKKDFIKFLQ